MSSGCNCGSNCSCGSSCNCGKMYPDVETAATAVVIIDKSPKGFFIESGEKSFGAEGGNGCKCGSNCKCDPCNC